MRNQLQKDKSIVCLLKTFGLIVHFSVHREGTRESIVVVAD